MGSNPRLLEASTRLTRMLKHLLGMAVLIACLMLGTLLPFLPGPYDSMAVPLSAMIQIFGKVGLLLVPIGILWVASASWSGPGGNQHAIAIAALIAASVVVAIVSLGAFAASRLLGVSVLALWIYIVSRVWPRLRRRKEAAPRRVSAIPFYLLVVPSAVALFQLAVLAPAIEFSRDRAIRNSARLIADIEQYRASNGAYPASLVSVWGDYSPGVIGIKEYHYEPSGDAYNLFFEQFTFHVGVREFVMYHPLDQQAMTSHRVDRLQLTPQQLIVDQSRGHNAVHNARHPHWKYFWFD